MIIYLSSPIFAFGSTCWLQQEEELKLLEEETARSLEETVLKNVEDKLNSEEVKLETERCMAEVMKKLFDDVEKEVLLLNLEGKKNRLQKRENSWIRCLKRIGGGWKKPREALKP